MNLGDHVGDEIQNVEANRAALQSAIASRPIFLKQVHGVGVEHLTAATQDGTVADACITAQRGVACTIMVADCLPVLLTNTAGTVVAAAHAGWRGLAGAEANGELGGQGVLEATFSSFQALNKPLAKANPSLLAPEIIAWLGPCIGPDAFEVGAEVKAVFEASQTGAGQFFTAGADGKYFADLAGLAKARLTKLGVTQIYGNDSTAPWCTVANPSKFFSHRRDATRGGLKTTGRMAACIWLG